MTHFNYISCLLGDAKEYGEAGMEYIPLYKGEEVEFLEVMYTIGPYLLELGLEPVYDRIPGVGVYTYAKDGKDGSVMVSLVTNEGDDDFHASEGFVRVKATVFATTHEFDSVGEEIEQWLKTL